MRFLWSRLVVCVTGNGGLLSRALCTATLVLTQACATLRGYTDALHLHVFTARFFSLAQACATLRGHTDALRAVAWSPDNSTLITTSTDRSWVQEFT